jgi:hypothetical protein
LFDEQINLLGGLLMITVKDLFENEELMNNLVEDIEDFSEDTPVAYDVWAIGYDEEDSTTGVEMMLGTFDNPDQAVHYAKSMTLSDVVNLAADDNCETATGVHYISIEVETTVPDDEGNYMNVGTVFKKKLAIYEELPEYVPLTSDDFALLEDGDIMVPRNILSTYKVGDCFTAVFDGNKISQPMVYKISSEIGDCFVCEFV